MANQLIHLINPKATSFTTRPIYFGRALYSPLAGLLAVAASIPRDQYDIVLTDENIEPIDFDLDCSLVGISAMTSYINQAYEIADEYRRRGVKVVMGGVHPSFLPTEALQHADCVVIGEAELIMPRLLDDLKHKCLQKTYQADKLLPMDHLPIPRYDLVKKNRYLNSAFINTCRGCHHACTFCAEHLMFGLKYRYRPTNEVIREIELCNQKTIALNAADFFGQPDKAAELMAAIKPLNINWQAGVNSRDANNDYLLELAAASGCQMLSIGFESISRNTLKQAHKYQNHPDQYAALVEKIQSYGILVFGLFMFGFDGDDQSVFDQTVDFNINAKFDVCAYSVMTPYPGTLDWFKMLKADRIINFDWNNYDQGHIVYQPKTLTRQQLRQGHVHAYKKFYAAKSLAKRFPWQGQRSKTQWTVYNAFFKRSEVNGQSLTNAITQPTEKPLHIPTPPLMPQRKDWQQLVQVTPKNESTPAPNNTRQKKETIATASTT